MEVVDGLVVVVAPRLEFRNTSTGSIIHIMVLLVFNVRIIRPQIALNGGGTAFDGWWALVGWCRNWGEEDYYLALVTFMKLAGYLPDSVLITGNIIMCSQQQQNVNDDKSVWV